MHTPTPILWGLALFPAAAGVLLTSCWLAAANTRPRIRIRIAAFALSIVAFVWMWGKAAGLI